MTQRLPDHRALAAHAAAMARGADCVSCPMYATKAGPIPSTVVPNARLTIVGEAPGGNELLQGQNFVGASGRILNQALDRGNLQRSDCTIANTIACRPPEEYTIYVSKLKAEHERAVARFDAGETTEDPGELRLPAQCCAPRLARDIEDSKSKVILAVGAQALRAMADYFKLPYGKRRKGQGAMTVVKGIKDQHGSPIPLPDGRILCSSYHPAFAMRASGRAFMPVIRADITRAAAIANRGYINWQPPKSIIFPTVEKVEEICRLFVEANTKVTVDIETNGKDARKCMIRCIGMGAVVDGEEVVIVVPFRKRQGNGEWWPDTTTKMRVVRAVRSVLDSCTLVGHNVVQFDSTVLLRYGLISDRRKQLRDTILMAKDSDLCELPRGLEFVSTRFLETPAWKIGHDDKFDPDTGQGSDEELQKYCGMDVGNTLRIEQRLTQRMAELGSTHQFDIDTELAPIFRDMGDLGLCVDTERRRRLAIILQDELKTRRQDIADVLADGSYFKNGQVPQEIQDFLKYGTPKKQKPPKKTKSGKPSKAKVAAPKGFNPNTPTDIGHFLYKIKKLVPLVNTRGKDFKEGEKAAAGAPALIRLLANGVDAQTRDFIDAYFIFKAYEKLASTYVGRIAKKDLKKKGVLIKEGELYGGFPMEKEDWSKQGYGKLHVLHTVYNLFKIASGRVSTRPACQNWSERAREATCYDCLGDGVSGPSVGRCTKCEKEAAVATKVDVATVSPIHHCRICHAKKCAFCKGKGKQYDRKTETYSDTVVCKACRADGRTKAALNMRSMIVAPPGHTFVGADFDQVELRIYAAIAQDKLVLGVLRNGRDPHCFNFANLAAETLEEAEAVYAKLQAMGGKNNKKVKELRNVAKRFCIAEDELVLTNRGLVPIQSVELTDQLWDGVEWVSHDGVVYQGTKEVIEYDGLRATRDHEVWIADGQKITFKQAAKQGLALARTGRGRHPIRFMDDNRASGQGRQILHGHGSMSMRCQKEGEFGQSSVRKVQKLLQLWRKERTLRRRSNYSTMASVSNDGCTAAVPESEISYLSSLRRTRDRIPFRVCRRCRTLGHGKSRFAQRFRNRPQRQQWSLRTWQSSLGDATSEYVQQEKLEAFGRLGLQRVRMALQQEDNRTKTARGEDAGRDHAGSARIYGERRELVRPCKETVRVYDILNAGPRRRFTVSNSLASNCFLLIYGGEVDKLYATMSQERDKSTGELSFPNVTEKDCIKWHKNWCKLHPWMMQWQNAAKQHAEKYGYATSAVDMRRRFFSGGAAKQNAPVNHTVQASSADFANRALIAIEKKIPHRGWSPLSGLMLQVHDCIIACVPDDRVEEAKKIIEEAMTFELNGVPITAAASVGKCWMDI